MRRSGLSVSLDTGHCPIVMHVEDVCVCVSVLLVILVGISWKGGRHVSCLGYGSIQKPGF